MELIEVILSKENLNRAYKKVVANKGASGVDGVSVEELGDYIRENKEKIVTSIRTRTYILKPVRRVYIPKDNGRQRPLGIPTALDRTIQQAIAQPISDIYENIFSEHSYGFRPGRSCHDAVRQALEYLNEGYEWVVDIEQFFDKVNHDKLIQILREQVNDSTTLNLIRKYLKAGMMKKGVEKEELMQEAKPYSISKKAVIAAYQRVKANKGTYGVDEQSIEDFEKSLNNNLYKIWNRMSSGTYFPKPVKAVAIPKKNGGTRILGIPTVEDRIAQMVVKLYFEPCVEPIFYEDSYGYRPNKSAIQALEATRTRCWRKDLGIGV